MNPINSGLKPEFCVGQWVSLLPTGAILTQDCALAPKRKVLMDSLMCRQLMEQLTTKAVRLLQLPKQSERTRVSFEFLYGM
eukprot:5525090-Amphidinium_carterae.1